MQNILQPHNEVALSTRVSQPVAERLADLARRDGRTLAGQLRFLVQQAVNSQSVIERR